MFKYALWGEIIMSSQFDKHQYGFTPDLEGAGIDPEKFYLAVYTNFRAKIEELLRVSDFVTTRNPTWDFYVLKTSNGELKISFIWERRTMKVKIIVDRRKEVEIYKKSLAQMKESDASTYGEEIAVAAAQEAKNSS
tara:strand:- start:43 stop:450 length:408 start_codon:yes stop_codon:yes gene_type:complete